MDFFVSERGGGEGECGYLSRTCLGILEKYLGRGVFWERWKGTCSQKCIARFEVK